MKSAAWGLILVVLLACSPAGARADLVVNGGFETGDFTGWTVTAGASGSYIVVSSFGTAHTGAPFGPHSGQYEASFGGIGPGDDSISQTLSTTPGQSYVLEYWLANISGPGPTEHFQASWGGQVISASIISNAEAFPYTEYSFTVVASASMTQIQFSGHQDDTRFTLDDVSVTPMTATPEPSSFVLMLLGAVGLLVGHGGWRRRHTPLRS